MTSYECPYKGKEPELGWSLHMTGGWQAQLDRVRRWYHRASTAENQTDKYDFLYVFFENAFHLRDCLKDTGAIDEENLKNLFKGNFEMRLCRDLANSHKHYSLDKSRKPVPPTEVREYSPGMGNLNIDISLIILRNGMKYDAFALAGRILRIWEDFISSHIAK